MSSASSSASATSEPAKPAPRKRVPAEERREQVLVVAAEVIARDGMHAASTAEIAKKSGISHAYLFRLFPTKDELLVAVALQNAHGIRLGMVRAGERARARGEQPLVDMAQEFQDMLGDRTRLQVMLQSISAAASIPALGDRLRAEWEGIVEDIERLSGAGPDDTRAFMAQGMLLMTITGLGAQEATWVERLHHGPLPCDPGQIVVTSLEQSSSAPS